MSFVEKATNLGKALLILLIVVLVGALVYTAYRAIKHPAEFAQSVTKTTMHVMLQANDKARDVIYSAIDSSLGKIPPPALGKAVGGLARTTSSIGLLPSSLVLNFTDNLASGDVSGAFSSLSKGPVEVFNNIKSIF